MWMWVHVFGVTSNWILPLSGFRPWFAFAEKVFFVRSQRWLKRGIFYPDPLCNLNTCESFCPLLKIIPPRTSAGQEGLLSPISSSIPLSTKVSDKRLISFLSSQRGPISWVVIWPFPIASVHLLETIWNWFNSQTCPSDAKTCPSDVGRKQKHKRLTTLSPLFPLCWTVHV